MSNFSYQSELKKIIDTKQLTQISFNTDSEFKASYIVNANDEYLTLIEINPSATLAGIAICRVADIESIKVETLYLKEFMKMLPDDSLYQQAMKKIEHVKEFSFDGFASAFEKTDAVIGIACENDDTFAGRIVDHDDKVLVLDEFYVEYDHRFARSYIKLSTVSQISFEFPWLRTITRSLADKKL